MKCTKVWAFLKLVYANQWFAVVVVVVVVVGSFRIRFGSGCLEPKSTTPRPLCFTSRCRSSREWARPTCPWSCACGRTGAHGYACGFCFFFFLLPFRQSTRERQWYLERELKRRCWLNMCKMTLEASVCPETKTEGWSSWTTLSISFLYTLTCTVEFSYLVGVT